MLSESAGNSRSVVIREGPTIKSEPVEVPADMELRLRHARDTVAWLLAQYAIGLEQTAGEGKQVA